MYPSYIGNLHLLPSCGPAAISPVQPPWIEIYVFLLG